MAQSKNNLKKRHLSTGAALLLKLGAALVIVAALLVLSLVVFVRNSVSDSMTRYNALYQSGVISSYTTGMINETQMVDSYTEFLHSQYVSARNLSQTDMASLKSVRANIYDSLKRLQANFDKGSTTPTEITVGFIPDAFGPDDSFAYDNSTYAAGQKRDEKSYYAPYGSLDFSYIDDGTGKAGPQFHATLSRKSVFDLAAFKEFHFKSMADLPKVSSSIATIYYDKDKNGLRYYSMAVLRPIYVGADEMSQVDVQQRPGVVGFVMSTVRLSSLIDFSSTNFTEKEIQNLLKQFELYFVLHGDRPGMPGPRIVRIRSTHHRTGKGKTVKPVSETLQSASKIFGRPEFIDQIKQLTADSKGTYNAFHYSSKFYTKAGVPKGEKLHSAYSAVFQSMKVSNRRFGLLIVTPQRYRTRAISAVVYPIVGTLLVSFILLLIFDFFSVNQTIKGVMRGVGAEPKEISELTGYIADGKLYALEQYGHMSGTAVGAFKNVLSMTDALIKFFTRLHENVRHVSQTSSDLSSNTEEIAGALTEINSTMQMTKDQVNTQQKRVVSVQEELDGLDQNILKLVQVLSEESAAIVESSQSIDAMFSTMTQVSSASDETLKNVKKLEEVSDEGKVRLNSLTDQITTINDQSSSLEDANKMIAGIASRTTLLAMNAAIEAAHAGEAGKGFAVVADEIRNLALQASEQSEQVQSRVKMIKESISQVADSSKLTATSFNAISSSIGSVAELSKQMQSSMEDQVSSAKSVVDKLSEMKSSNASVKTSSDKMQEGKNSMLTAMESLSQISQEVNGAIDQIAQAVSEMTLAITNVRDLSSDNFNDVKEIQETAKGFQLSKDGITEEDQELTNEAPKSDEADGTSTPEEK